MEAVAPLAEAVTYAARAAAFEDHRFPPVVKGELSSLTMEISVLSESIRVASADDIQLGVHGVVVKKGGATGVFLPQVGIDHGWSKDEFLTRLCVEKAGLSPEAWREADTKLFVFTAHTVKE